MAGVKKQRNNSVSGVAVLLGTTPEVIEAMIQGQEGYEAMQKRILELEMMLSFKDKDIKELCQKINDITVQYK